MSLVSRFKSHTTLQFYRLPPILLKQAYYHDTLLQARLAHAGGCQVASCG